MPSLRSLRVKCADALSARPFKSYNCASLAILFSLCGLLGGCSRHVEPEHLALAVSCTANRPASTLDAANNWLGFRGGALGGVSPATSLPATWSSSENVRWRVPLVGRGNSSPVVVRDRVFLTAERHHGERISVELLCFDRATGRQAWSKTVAACSGPTHQKNGYASATPASNGEQLFVSLGSAGLHCFDFHGQQLWSVEFGPGDHEWGSASSPVVYGNVVIQLCDRRDDSFLAAFEASSGQQVWRTTRPSTACWSTPVLVEARRGQETRTELVVNGTGGSPQSSDGGWMIAYDPQTGREIWRARGTSDLVCPSPIVGDGLVVSSSGRNGPILAVRAGGHGDVTGSHVAWRHGHGGPYVPTGLALDGRLYLLRDEGIITCHDLVTGNLIWQDRLRGAFTASLVAAGEKLYATNEQGMVYVLAAGDKFKPLAENRLGDGCLATPAIAGGELFFRTESWLWCVDKPKSTATELAREDDEVGTRHGRNGAPQPVGKEVSLTTVPSTAQKKPALAAPVVPPSAIRTGM